MTDDDNSGWNAFSRVFGDCTQLLCKWHVKRAWGNKIPLCGSKQLQEEVYRTLEVILEETSIETFEKMLVRFLRKYEDICPKFVNYFKNTYVSRPVKWAMCYRHFEHANTDTNIFVESFHNKLKTFYLERMPNKRIDDLINVLLEIEADDYWSHKRRIVYLDVPKKDIDSGIRYERGINIPDAHMTALSKSKWSVQSQSKNVTYTINQITENCNCLLGKQQISCVGLCEHIYSCNCNDKAKICKHIYKVHSTLNREIKQCKTNLKINEKDDTDAVSDEASNISLELETSEECNRNSDEKENVRMYKTFDPKYTNTHYEDSSRCKNNVRVCKSLTERLLRLTETESIKSLFLPKMISALQDLVKQAEDIVNIDTGLNLDHMSPSYKPMPNEKLGYQWRPGKLYKTRKEVKKKKKVNTTTEEKSNISADLLNKEVKLESKDLPVFDIESKKRKSESNCKRSKKMFKIQKDTNDIVPDLKVKSVTTPLIKYGCHNLSYLSLKSLETHCSPSCISDIKKTDPYFQVGWLHDEIVDSYLFLLELKFSHVLYCGSVEARAIVAGKSMKSLWKNQQLFNKELVFVPYNPSGVHWLLIVLNLLQSTIMLLDPML